MGVYPLSLVFNKLTTLSSCIIKSVTFTPTVSRNDK